VTELLESVYRGIQIGNKAYFIFSLKGNSENKEEKISGISLGKSSFISNLTQEFVS